VIVSVRSLLVVGDGRLEAACTLPEAKYKSLLEAASVDTGAGNNSDSSPSKRQKCDDDEDVDEDDKAEEKKKPADAGSEQQRKGSSDAGGMYSASEAEAAYSHLSDYHKKKGWDTSGWWARKG
jgi:ubiquitin-conjugating enzyme E2 Q